MEASGSGPEEVGALENLFLDGPFISSPVGPLFSGRIKVEEAQVPLQRSSASPLMEGSRDVEPVVVEEASPNSNVGLPSRFLQMEDSVLVSQRHRRKGTRKCRGGGGISAMRRDFCVNDDLLDNFGFTKAHHKSWVSFNELQDVCLEGARLLFRRAEQSISWVSDRRLGMGVSSTIVQSTHGLLEGSEVSRPVLNSRDVEDSGQSCMAKVGAAKNGSDMHVKANSIGGFGKEGRVGSVKKTRLKAKRRSSSRFKWSRKKKSKSRIPVEVSNASLSDGDVRNINRIHLLGGGAKQCVSVSGKDSEAQFLTHDLEKEAVDTWNLGKNLGVSMAGLDLVMVDRLKALDEEDQREWLELQRKERGIVVGSEDMYK